MMFLEDLIRVRRAISEMTGSDLLTNALDAEKELVIQAAKDTEFNIYIEREAFAGPFYHPGMRSIPGAFAIYTWDMGKDHTPFFARWRQLQRIRNGA